MMIDSGLVEALLQVISGASAKTRMKSSRRLKSETRTWRKLTRLYSDLREGQISKM